MSAAPERLGSLDVARGLAVVGMIVVNWAAIVDHLRLGPVPQQLLHAKWVGITLADLVFPAFVFLMGLSFALRSPASSKSTITANVWFRTIRLFTAGWLLSNLQWLASPDGGAFRLMGVLQRPALVYIAGALIVAYASPRLQVWIALAVLLGYWLLLLVPPPNLRPPDLYSPGMNFVSWFDRFALGRHIYVAGEAGYDPEGILGTLPAIAQCLLGVQAGRWLRTGHTALHITAGLAAAGFVGVAFGLLWSPLLPISKPMWSSSFVLLTTGVTLLVFALIYWVVDVHRRDGPTTAFLEAFGVNAVTAYILHSLVLTAMTAAAARLLLAGPRSSAETLLAVVMSFVGLVGFTWSVAAYLRRRGIIVRI